MRKILGQNAVKLVCFDKSTVRWWKSKGNNGAIAVQWRRLSGSDDHSRVTARHAGRDATSGQVCRSKPKCFP